MFYGKWVLSSEDTNNLITDFEISLNINGFNFQIKKEPNSYSFIYDNIEGNHFVLIGNIYSLNNQSLKAVDKNIIHEINQLYLLNQDKVGSKINGDFILFIINTTKPILKIIRDRIGIVPCYYTCTDEGLFFSFYFKSLSTLDIQNREINYQWISDCIQSVNSEKNFTVFNNIYRLPPACLLKMEEKKLTTFKYYKYSDITEEDTFSKESYISQLENKLVMSINNRLLNSLGIGSELSGGLDSSVVTAIASKILKNEVLYAFSQTLNPEKQNKIFPYKDELEYSSLVVSDLKNICHIKINGEKNGLIKTLRNTVKKIGYPIQHNFAQYLDEIIEDSKEKNISIILSGFGGDQCVSNKSILYLKEKISKFQFIEALKYIHLFNKKRKTEILKILFQFILQTKFPKLYNVYFRLLKRTLYPIKDLYNKDFRKKIKIRYKFFEKEKTLNEVLYNKLSYNYIPHRIESINELVMLDNICYKFPLLDIELVELFLKIPSKFKANTKETRHIFRQTIKSYVPKAIWARESKNGATIPNSYAKYLIDYDAITEFIIYCKNNLKNHYVNYDTVLEIHKKQKTKTKNTINNNFGHFVKILSVLIFQDLYERGEL
jgi:asparagine synthase (glutamine-hydrolysing)